MSKFLLDKNFYEHHEYPDGEDVSDFIASNIQHVLFKGNIDKKCVEIKVTNNKTTLHTSYYVGVDWIAGTDHCIYVEPKLNKLSPRTNYLKMLVDLVSHSDVAVHAKDLFEIKFDQPYISIKQEQDLLTPLLAVHFLVIMKEIVRKGLKKSYYVVNETLYGKVKGKVLVGQTIKQNILKNKTLHTNCSHNEFGYNNPENRLLKKALLFIQRYLPSINHLKIEGFSADIFNFINPSFDAISDDISINDIKHSKLNVFYKEYEEAIRLAKLILRRYGYNISNVLQEEIIKTPPFWIDMSKLFELYTLGLLKDRFKHKVEYHFQESGNELDFLLNSEEYKIVIDAKYKLRYLTGLHNEDMHQVSGYARLNTVYEKMGKTQNEIIDCLIIYPDQGNGHDNLLKVDFTNQSNKIKEYAAMYKVPIMLPVI
jgi:5-methylcytosine-specific restriction enzyme subunit McrC